VDLGLKLVVVCSTQNVGENWSAYLPAFRVVRVAGASLPVVREVPARNHDCNYAHEAVHIVLAPFQLLHLPGVKVTARLDQARTEDLALFVR